MKQITEISMSPVEYVLLSIMKILDLNIHCGILHETVEKDGLTVKFQLGASLLFSAFSSTITFSPSKNSF